VREHETEQRAIAREVPGVREHETEQRAAAREVPGVQEHETEQQAAARDEPGVREQEQSANTVSRAIARAEPGVREHETEQRAAARLDPALRARESRQRAVARGKKTYAMACQFKNGEYLFHQPCGLWNEPCVHGCGYIHLSNSTPGTRKKCCVNGLLSSVSDNFEEGLMMGYVLDELPAFVVCNYNETAGFSRRGPGPQSVFMNGRVHHYMRIASSTLQNCGISYFILMI
jgi:hypothetical protein